MLKKIETIAPDDSLGANITIEYNNGKVWRLMPRRNPDVNKSWLHNDTRLLYQQLDQNRLVEGIVAEARACEAAGAWGQAVDQWNNLATIYDRFPNLEYEIERVRAARDEAETRATGHWTAQLEPLMQGGEFGKAGQVLERALTELPESERGGPEDREFARVRSIDDEQRYVSGVKTGQGDI